MSKTQSTEEWKHSEAFNSSLEKAIEILKARGWKSPDEVEQVEKDVVRSGHWFAREKQLDAYWNFAYYCQCGFGASNRKAIDGHVEWMKAALHQAEKKEVV